MEASGHPQPFPSLIVNKVIQGTCGWTDSSLISCKRFYPAGAKTTNDKLHHYSRGGGFGCVEVDSSTYAIPSKQIVAGWVGSTPVGFTFHFKAFSALCWQALDIQKYPHSVQRLCPNVQGAARVTELPAAAQDALWADFNDSVAPALSANRFGSVLFQFHFEFRPTNDGHRDYLRICAEKIDSRYRLAFDFRNREWFADGVLDDTISLLRSLRPNGVALVGSDDLESEFYGRSMALSAAVNLPVHFFPDACSDFAYIRVHRRAGSDRILKDAEISEWVKRIVSTESNKYAFGGAIFVLWGTDHEDQGIKNSRKLFSSLPPELRLDWKAHTRSMKGGVMSAFQSMKDKASTSSSPLSKSDYVSPPADKTGYGTVEDTRSSKRPLDGSTLMSASPSKKKTPGGSIFQYLQKSSPAVAKQPRDDAKTVVKSMRFTASSGLTQEITIHEYLGENLSVFTWPSAIVISCFLVANKELFRDKEILELGGGTGLPSLVAAAIGAKSVEVTERPESKALELLRYSISLNKLSNCTVNALDWSNLLDLRRYVDIVLGSDVFYSTEDFDPVLCTVATLMEVNPNLVFLTTYQERSSKRTLVPYLEKYGMESAFIPLDGFFRSEIESSSDVTAKCACSVAHLSGSTNGDAMEPFQEPTDIFLIRITRKLRS